jgi:hypothetical protein
MSERTTRFGKYEGGKMILDSAATRKVEVMKVREHALVVARLAEVAVL